MKSKISDRPLFNKSIEEDEVENVGIMQGFMDEMEAEDEAEEMENDDDNKTAMLLDRKPNSPEILMNNLRGDMRSIDARFEELADLVGYNAASETPEEVLALLQPVLAQQQAMPQGGIPAAMPPEMGAIEPNMSMMPPGMPPMPPEAAMGGIGALPADQGPAPVAMAMGGYVQSFRDGSDEDGVTPAGESSSYPMGTFSPEMVQLARQEIARSLLRQPLAVPDLMTQVEERTPMYEKLLGVDKNLNQAQILFELGQRAFNYGANVDDQGRPLRGSQAARFAGAVRTLPGAMGNIIAQTEQQKRAVRAAALQAAEKDVQNIREQNIKTEATKQKLYGDILKSSTAGAKMFGSSLEGIAHTTLLQLAPDYAKGKLPPELDQKFETALTIVTQPRQTTDPFTGNIMTITPKVPDYVTKAVAERKKLPVVPPSVKPGPEGTTGKVYDEGDLSYLAGKDTGPVINAEEYVTPTAAAAGKEKKPKKGELPGRTLWNSAPLVAGPIPTLTSMASRVPGLGDIAPQMQQARSFATSAVNDLVSNLRTNDRFSETERKEIKNEIDISPRFWDDPTALRNRMIGIDEFLSKKIADWNTQVADTTLPVKIRQDAADRVADTQKFLSTLGVPIRIYSLEDVEALPPNTPFLWNGTEPRVKNR